RLPEKLRDIYQKAPKKPPKKPECSRKHGLHGATSADSSAIRAPGPTPACSVGQNGGHCCGAEQDGQGGPFERAPDLGPRLFRLSCVACRNHSLGIGHGNPSNVARALATARRSPVRNATSRSSRALS